MDDRGEWKSKTEFILSCMGYCIGLTNVWRFPYMAYEYGGGPFIVPYLLMLILLGLPTLYLELSVGLITQGGSVEALYKICPLAKGTGLASVLMSFLFVGYFSAMCGYVLYYVGASLSLSGLPWASCNHHWATSNCFDGSEPYTNKSVAVTQEYFNIEVLSKSSGIEDYGSLRIRLAACAIFCWFVIYACIFKGAKVMGKVVYLTVIVPYFLLIVMLIRGLTLEGAIIGIEYFLGLNGKSDWSRLYEIRTWIAAATQILFSLGIGMGSLIAFSSYNKNNTTILGNISHSMGLEVRDLATSGPELIFVSLPQDRFLEQTE